MHLPTDIQNLINDLAIRVKTREVSQIDIHQATGVDQSQISRIISGKAKRYSNNVKKICRYANTIKNKNPSTEKYRKELVAKTLDLWDGTPEKANQILRLLNSIKVLQQTGNIDDK